MRIRVDEIDDNKGRLMFFDNVERVLINKKEGTGTIFKMEDGELVEIMIVTPSNFSII